jgi:hypothetical protein
MRACLVLIVLLVGGWTDEPPAWERPRGRPIDPVLFQRDRSFCRGQVSLYFGREWVAAFTDCMQHLGYIPLRRDILP